MNNTLKYILIGVAGVIIGFLATFLFTGSNPAGGSTNYGGDLVVEALTVNGTLTQTGAVTVTGATTENGKLTTNAGYLRSYTSATTTGTAVTLKVSDILNYDTIEVNPIVGATTLTFPASSTMTTLVPTAGDMQETCIYNATSTAAATITFVAGTGMNWQTVATSTGSAQVPPAIAAGGSGCFKFIRQAATSAKFDINALYTPYVNAD